MLAGEYIEESRNDLMKRQRGRGRRSGGGNNNNPNKHFESTGPDVKIRGSAQQILDKYQQYARDAQSSGDRVNAENYLQHAEHYYRVLAAMKPVEKPRPEPREDEAGGEKSETDASGEDGQKRDAQEGTNRGRTRSRNRRDRDDRKPETNTEASPEANIDAEANTDDGETVIAQADTPVAVASDDAGDLKTEGAPAPEAEEKPKRRRTYKKREPKPEASQEGDDGVMKTLSRGRKKADAEATSQTVATAPAPAGED